MISSLAPCFTGAFLWYKDGLALASENGSSIPGFDLLDGRVTSELMSRYAATYPGGDRRALVSMWTQWHFGALVIPTTAAATLLDRDLPVELDRVGIALHHDGRTASIVLPDGGEARRPSVADRFARLFDGHIDPLIEHFAHHFGMSKRLLWTNAATVFEWTLQQAAAFDNASPVALAEGRALLERQFEACGRRNPMQGAVQWHQRDGQPVRRRKVCCLRYLLPGMEECGDLCPLPQEALQRTKKHEVCK